MSRRHHKVRWLCFGGMSVRGGAKGVEDINLLSTIIGSLIGYIAADILIRLFENTKVRHKERLAQHNLQKTNQKKELSYLRKFVDYPRCEILEAVKNNGLSLRYVEDPDREICLEAVKNNGLSLRYVKDPDREICLEAVKNDGLALGYVKAPDRKICLEAVKSDGMALVYIKDPDHEICLEAVKSNGLALQYVSILSEEILNAAATAPAEDKEAYKEALENASQNSKNPAAQKPDTN